MLLILDLSTPHTMSDAEIQKRKYSPCPPGVYCLKGQRNTYTDHSQTIWDMRQIMKPKERIFDSAWWGSGKVQNREKHLSWVFLYQENPSKPRKGKKVWVQAKGLTYMGPQSGAHWGWRTKGPLLMWQAPLIENLHRIHILCPLNVISFNLPTN